MISKRLSFVAGLLQLIAGAALIASGICVIIAAVKKRERWE